MIKTKKCITYLFCFVLLFLLSSGNIVKAEETDFIDINKKTVTVKEFDGALKKATGNTKSFVSKSFGIADTKKAMTNMQAAQLLYNAYRYKEGKTVPKDIKAKYDVVVNDKILKDATKIAKDNRKYARYAYVWGIMEGDLYKNYSDQRNFNEKDLVTGAEANLYVNRIVDAKQRFKTTDKAQLIRTTNLPKKTTTTKIDTSVTAKNGLYFKDSYVITESSAYKTWEFDVNYGDTITYIGGSSGNANLYDTLRVLDNSGNIIYYERNTGGTVEFNGTYNVPQSASKMILTFRTSSAEKMILLKRDLLNPSLKDKKIVWFGTSIPEGKYNRGDKRISYPELVGEKLGATVFNEAVGESKVHAYRSESAITEDNPYGIISTDFISTAKCLSNDLNVQEWLIENYNNPQFTSGTWSNMTDERKAMVRSWSYQEKIDKYLTAETFPDLFVFDHGRNDMWISQDWTFNADAPYSLYNASYQSAMNFLIRRILEYNPKAKIVIIGHYTNQIRNPLDGMTDRPDKIAQGQMEVAEYWDLPLFKLWEKTGWSNKTITVNGVDKSVLASWMPDKLHPHSDTSGQAIEHLAEILTPFIRDNLQDDDS